MVNNEAKVKAVLAVSFFVISMVVVGMLAYNSGYQAGYEKGYADANQDWIDYLNEVWGPFIDLVYQEGYAMGFDDGYLWGYVAGWLEYGEGEIFKYPRDPVIP